jgi:hypothetical protein
MQELAITWQRVARVWWLITWRSFVGAMVLAMIFGFVVGVVRYVAQVDIPSSYILSVVVGWFVGFGWLMVVVRMALTKNYIDFRLTLVPVNIAARNDAMKSDSDMLGENMEFTLNLADQILRSTQNPLEAFIKAVGTLAQVVHIITADDQREQTLKRMMEMLRTYLAALDKVRGPSSPTIR